MLNTLFHEPYNARLMVGMKHKPTKILEGKFRGKKYVYCFEEPPECKLQENIMHYCTGIKCIFSTKLDACIPVI